MKRMGGNLLKTREHWVRSVKMFWSKGLQICYGRHFWHDSLVIVNPSVSIGGADEPLDPSFSRHTSLFYRSFLGVKFIASKFSAAGTNWRSKDPG